MTGNFQVIIDNMKTDADRKHDETTKALAIVKDMIKPVIKAHNDGPTASKTSATPPTATPPTATSTQSGSTSIPAGASQSKADTDHKTSKEELNTNVSQGFYWLETHLPTMQTTGG